jgi:hypothetical protein
MPGIELAVELLLVALGTAVYRPGLQLLLKTVAPSA